MQESIMVTRADLLTRINYELRFVDTLAQIVLKGHLVMEELMEEAISTFVWHSEFVASARLTFAKKLQLCRSMSHRQQRNGAWEVIGAVNSLRNNLSHTLDQDKRQANLERVRQAYLREYSNCPRPFDDSDELDPDVEIAMVAIHASLGFLHAHLEETRRFKKHLRVLDLAMNDPAAPSPSE